MHTLVYNCAEVFLPTALLHRRETLLFTSSNEIDKSQKPEMASDEGL
jgi:hypothetical protein